MCRMTSAYGGEQNMLGEGDLPRRVSNTAATVRFSAGVSLAGSVHENFRWGTSMVGNVHEAGPMVTVDGGASAPKSEPETKK